VNLAQRRHVENLQDYKHFYYNYDGVNHTRVEENINETLSYKKNNIDKSYGF
jgi:hypothetical protein